MKAIGELVQEHRVIELVLTGLERVAARAEGSVRLEAEQAEKVLEILRNFADRCHHGKEERNLFPLMEARGVPRAGGPLGVMLEEHEMGRAHIRAMVEALPAAAAGEAEAVGRFVEHAQAYVALLRQHIQKEDRVLFPMAARVLSQEDDARLVEAFAGIEREEMGAGVHERYHQWAHELAESSE